MRFLFHAMLGFSMAVAATGIICGTVAQARDVHDGARLRFARGHEGETRVAIEQTIAPPLPVLPRYGESVMPGATLAWHLLDGTDGAQVEISSTPAFDPGSTRELEADGETVRLPGWLGAGVWYWRLRGRQGDAIGERTTSTWMVDVVAPASEPDWG